MRLGKKLFFLVVLVGIAAVLVQYYYSPEPKISEEWLKDGWFGKTTLKKGQAIPKDVTTINKFAINVADNVLVDLKNRLNSARFIDSIEGTNFNYGFNSNYLKQVVEYWKTKYDWKKQQNELNKYQHFTTQIEGINVHFVHVKPTKKAKTVLPLMLIHGWPGSFYEFYKSIPLLTEPVDDLAFELIIPSIPGYGFSEGPHQKGFSALDTARIFAKLMDRLGHKKFFVNGGDWGSFVGHSLSILFPEKIRGFHTTMINLPPLKGCAAIKFFTGMFFPSLVFNDATKDYNKLYPFLDKFYFILRESGYMHLQATKPDTVGAALYDSPVGLAAYILEKFSTWTNRDNVNKPDGGLTEKFTLDELLTNVMIYWLNNPTSSMRYYKENLNYEVFVERSIDDIPIKVPVSAADFPHELIRVPETLAKNRYHNLLQYTEMPRGGHFGAFEEPKLITDDIRRFIKKVLTYEENQANKDKKN